MTDNLGNVISNKTVSGSTNTTNFANNSLTPPTAAGTYSYALTLSYGGQTSNTCQAELEVETPNSSSSSENSSSSATVESSSSVKSLAITCGISTHNYDISGGDEFYTTNDLYFIGKNNVSEDKTYIVNVYNGSTSLGEDSISNWQNVSNLASLGKLSEGSYTFHVMYNNAVICSHTITVAEPVGCSVNSTTIGLGENFTFTTTYPGNCYWSTFTADPNDGSGLSSPPACQSSYSVTPTAVGTYTYTYGVTSGEYGTDSCSQTVTVERVAPTFACPSSARATIGASNNVSLSLGDVTGCDEGGSYCYYTITGDNDISVSGNSYTSGALPSFTDNTVTTDGTSKSYTVRLTNSVGDVTHACSVEFTAGSSFPCNAGNSTAIAKETEREDNANSCTKYTMDGASSVQIGCWWAPETPVTVNIMKCDGTTTSISHPCKDWKSVDVGGPCTVYLQPEKKIKWKFNNW